MSFTIHIAWKGRTTPISLPLTNPAVEELGLCIEKELGASYETIKLLLPGRRGHVAPARERGQLASAAGLTDGCKALLLASSVEDITRVRASRDLSALRGFEDELKHVARRRRTNRTDANLHPPRAEYTFGAYEAWQRTGLHPPPAEALKLLYRLASDPGILGLMETHRYRVGLLSEMPPEGKVGISPMCILGVNLNAGQEISLRLRTDDLKGLRKYERIRETLLHELAHMEYAEHDNNFKELNSQLGRECAAINSRYVGGRYLLTNEDNRFMASAAQVDRRSELDDPAFVLEGADAVMAATARFSGKTLRQLASISANGPHSVVLTSAMNAGKAAPTLTAVAASTMTSSGQQINRTALRGGDERVEMGQSATGRAAVECSGSAGGNSDASDGGDDERQFEHFDAATELTELAARQLGSMGDEQGEQQATNKNVGGSEAGEGGPGMEAEATTPHMATLIGSGMVSSMGPPPKEPSLAAELGALVTPFPSMLAVGGEVRDCMRIDAATRGVCKAGAAGSALESRPIPILESRGMLAFGGDTVVAPQESEVATDVGKMTSGIIQGSPLGHLPESDCSNKAIHHGGSGEQPVEECCKAPGPFQLALRPPMELLVGGSEDGGGGVFISGADNGLEAAQAKLRQAWDALTLMASAASAAHGIGQVESGDCSAIGSAHSIASAEDMATALDTIETVLGNAVHFPTEDRYRRVRLGNATFQRRVGRLPGGIELLRVAGFAEEGDALLRLRRNDPGLMWLVLSAVREAKEQVTAQLAGPTAEAIMVGSRSEANAPRQA